MKHLLILASLLFSTLLPAHWQTFLVDEANRLPSDDTPYVSLDRAIAHEANVERAWQAKDGSVTDEDLALYRYYVYARAREIGAFYSLDRQENIEAQLHSARTTPSQGWNYGQRHNFIHVAFLRTLQMASHLQAIDANTLKPVTPFVTDNDLLWTDPTLLESFILQTYRQTIAEGEDTFPELAVALQNAPKRLKDALDLERIELTSISENEISEQKMEDLPYAVASFEKQRCHAYETFLQRTDLTPAVRHKAILKLASVRQEMQNRALRDREAGINTATLLPFPKGAETIDALATIIDEATLYHLRWDAQNLTNHLRAQRITLLNAPAVIPVTQRTSTTQQTAEFTIAYANTKSLQLTLQKCDPLTGTPQGDPLLHTVTLPAAPDYAIATTALSLPPLSHGTYDLTFDFPTPTFKDLKQTPTTVRLLVSDFIASCVAENPVTYFVTDTQTGQPCVGATLTCGNTTATTNEHGLAVLSLPAPRVKKSKNSQRQPLAITYKGETLLVDNTYAEPKRTSSAINYLLYPNCSLYRPGDTLHAQLLVLQDDATHRRKELVANHQATLTILGTTPANDKVTLLPATPITFSEKGAYDFSLPLPKDFVGNLRILLQSKNKQMALALPDVIEFKPPTITATLTRINKDAPFGEPITHLLQAYDASGAPLVGATATCTIELFTTDEKPQTITATLDQNGQAHLSFTPQTQSSDTLISGDICVRLLAPTGERIDTSAYFTQYRHGFTLNINTPQWILSDTGFTVTLSSDERTITDNVKDAFEGALEVYTWDAKNKQRGDCLLTFRDITQYYHISLPAGNYQLRAVSGNVETTQNIIVLPLDGNLSSIDLTQNTPYHYWSANNQHPFIFLINDEKSSTFTVGDTLEAYIAAKHPIPFYYAISTLDGTKTFAPCKGPRFTLPITADMIGDASITLFGHYQGQSYTATRRIKITPPEELTLTASRLPDTVLPGSEQTWEIAVNDPNAELIITCYDAMIDQILPLHWSLLNTTFPKLGWSDIARLYPLYNSHLRISYMEALPRDPCAPLHFKMHKAKKSATLSASRPLAKAGGTFTFDAMANENLAVHEPAPIEGHSNTSTAPIRSNFARAATWQPQKRLINGKATFTFTLPDTLTTWHLHALAYTPDGRSGQLQQNITAKRDIMLRPYTPRHLRVGDNLTLRLAVINTTDETISTWVECNNTQRQTLTLAPKATQTLLWPLTATTPEPLTLTFTSPHDALTLHLPVYDTLITTTDTYPLTLKGQTPSTLELLTPTENTTLTERWNHRPCDAIIAALKQQLDYPYNCSEQTFAKINALLLLKNYNAAPKDCEQLLNQHLKTLLSMRTTNGLWRWFPNGKEDPTITAEICVGAARLKRLGLLPQQLDTLILETLQKNQATLPLPEWLYARTAWLTQWPIDKDYTDELLRVRKELPLLQRLYIIAAAQHLGLQHIAQQGLESILQTMTTSDLWGTQWPQEKTWWHWYSTPIESHALRAEILRTAGHIDLAEGAALWLLQNIRMTDWGTTRATTAATATLLQSEIAKQTLDEPIVKTTKVSHPENKTTLATYQKETPGLTFGSVAVTYQLPLQELPPLNLPKEYGVTLERTLTPANPKLGDTITVQLRIHAAQPLDRIWIQDQRPSNTEPLEQHPTWHWQTHAYLLPGDKGLDIFIPQLPRGTTIIQYKLKATHTGSALPGPATLQSMYAPDFTTRATTPHLKCIP